LFRLESTSSAANAAGDIILGTVYSAAIIASLLLILSAIVAWLADSLQAVALTQDELLAGNFSQAQTLASSFGDVAL
jgi:hypothetical protein